MTQDAPPPEEAVSDAPRGILRRCADAAHVCAREMARHAIEATALAFAVIVAVGVGLAWWLNQGPVSLDPFKDDIRAALARTFNAEEVELGAVTASWSSDLRSVVVTVTDVKVSDMDGSVLGEAPRLEAAVRLGALLQGKVVLSRMAAEGGAFSMVRLPNGALTATFGPPERLFAGVDDDPDALAPTPQAGPPDMLRGLAEVQLRNAAFHIVDARLGAKLTVRDASIRLSRRGDGFALRAVGGMPDLHPQAHFDARARISDDFQEGFLVAEVEYLSPAGVADADGPLAVLSRLDAPVSFLATAAFENGAVSLTGDIEAQIGAGTLRFLDEQDREVRSGTLRARFSDEGATLETLAFDVEGLNATFTGALRDVEEALRGEPGAVMDFDLRSENLVLDLRPVFADVLTIDRAEFNGAADLANLTVRFDDFTIALFEVEAAFRGDIRMQEASNGVLLPAVRVEGPLTGEVRPEHVMAAWPVEFIDPARDWVRDAILAGRAFDGYLRLDMPVEAWIEKRLDDDRLTFTFSYEDTEILYIETMTPLVGASGDVELRGNSLDARVERGTVRRIDVTNGYIHLPELKEPGGIARFGADGYGPVPDMLALLDSDPLYLLEPTGKTPDEFAGYGGGRMELSWPILDEVPPELVNFEIDGVFDDVFAPHHVEFLPLSGAKVTVKGRTDEIVARAEGRLGPARAVIDWVEYPLAEGGPRSEITVNAVIDNVGWDKLGFATREFLTGDVMIKADLIASEELLKSADVTMDFTEAAIRSPVSDWRKPAGAPGEGRLSYVFRDDGGYAFPDVRLSAEGLLLQGRASFGPDFQVESIVADNVVLEDYIEARGRVRRTANDGLLIDVAGSQFNANDLIFYLLNSEPAEIPTEFELLADFDRVTISKRDDLTDVTLAMTHNGTRIDDMTFRAGHAIAITDDAPAQPAAEGAQFITADVFPITTADDAARKLCVYSQDVSVLMRSVLLNDDFRGGVLTIDGDVPPASAPPEAPTKLFVRVGDFRLVNTPILAQLLSSVVSFKGLSDTLNGEGISFNRLTADVTTAENVFYFERALMSGPALGVSTSGRIDAEGEELSVQGTLAPAYGVSSVLGAIPVVGDVLTSREGEGVFGVTFSIRGPFTGANIRVNPLSALAPGILRRIFEGRLRDDERFDGEAAPERVDDYACFPEGGATAARVGAAGSRG